MADFEDWTAEQFTRAGYQASRTPRTGDAGADVILRPPAGSSARAVICQCKHRALGAGALDEDAVHEVLKAAKAYAGRYPWLGEPVLLAVTNGRTTLAASRMAAEKGVIMVDGSRVDGLAGIALEIVRMPPGRNGDVGSSTNSPPSITVSVLRATQRCRLSRDQEDVAGLFKRLRFAGIRIVTLAEGEISELHVGLKGTMNALFLRDQ